MGAGASTANARATMSSMVSNKPADASDITTLEQGIAEIVNLRKLAKDLEAQATGGGGSGGKAPVNAAKKRGAVYDGAKQATSTAPYEAKVIEKPSFIRQMLLDIVASNILFSSYTYDEHNAIVDAFDKSSSNANEFVIKQGESGFLCC